VANGKAVLELSINFILKFMKNFFFTILSLSCFSVFSQNSLKVSPESFDAHHRVFGGAQFPLRVHIGYEFQYRHLQLSGFLGFTPKFYQDLVFQVLQKIKHEYVEELGYLRMAAEPKIQFGGDLKLDIGKNISIGLTAQTFNASVKDTPKNITRGILPEESVNIEALIDYSATVKNAYENKVVEAFMNNVVAGPIIEKTVWLNKSETFCIRAKFAYMVLVARENVLKSQDFTPIEQFGIDFYKPRFLNKLAQVSSKLQAPSIGLELGISF